MKNKIVKILGVVLAVAILVGLLIPAMPVSAGTLSWTAATLPSTKNFQLVQGFDANLYSVAPDGKTIFAYGAAEGDVEEVDGSPVTTKLYKSVDGGVTWTDKNIGENIKGTVAVPIALKIIFVPKDYATEKTIYAVIGTEIWRSRNGGASFAMWQDVATLADPLADILTIDEAQYFRYSGNVAVLVCGSNGIALYNDYDAVWETITAGVPIEELKGTAYSGSLLSQLPE